MDWGTIIVGIVGCISGNITALLFFPQMRRMKDIENETKQSDEWRKLYEEAKSELREKDKKIDSLYDEIQRHRDVEIDLHKEVGKLSAENIKLLVLKCEVPACTKRTPPTGF